MHRRFVFVAWARNGLAYLPRGASQLHQVLGNRFQSDALSDHAKSF